jgi:hypothetical protein
VIAIQLDHVSKRNRAGRSRSVIDMVAANGDCRRGGNSQGHRFLFEALATNAVLANVRLIVVGDADLRQARASDVAARGLGGRMHVPGARGDRGSLLGAWICSGGRPCGKCCRCRWRLRWARRCRRIQWGRRHSRGDRIRPDGAARGRLMRPRSRARGRESLRTGRSAPSSVNPHALRCCHESEWTGT